LGGVSLSQIGAGKWPAYLEKAQGHMNPSDIAKEPIGQEQAPASWPNETTVVSVNDSQELSCWCKWFGASSEEVKEAVITVGINYKDVEWYFSSKHQ